MTTLPPLLLAALLMTGSAESPSGPALPICGGAIVPEIPYHMAAAAAPADLRLADPTVTHVIDIAFVYDPDLRHSYGGVNRETVPYSIGQLRKDIAAAIRFANVAFAKSNVNAALRFVGMEERNALRGLASLVEAVGVAQNSLPLLRDRYGADLVYAIPARVDKACGRAFIRNNVFDFAREFDANGAVWVGCLGGRDTLVHEVGHNLGLRHDIENSTGPPYVEYGRGHVRHVDGHAVDTIMAVHGLSRTGSRIGEFSSADRRWLGTIPIGDATTDASRALLYTIEDASNYAPTKVRDPAPVADCAESDTTACLDRGRFEVQATYSVNGVDGRARERAAMLDGDGALFYFFDPGNPELLVKVANGCWLNGHYWVFGSAATDLGYTIRITNLAASRDDPGRWSSWHVQGGVIERRRAGGESRVFAGSVVGDTYAFPCADASAIPVALRSAIGRRARATLSFGHSTTVTDRDPLYAAAEVHSVPAWAKEGPVSDYGCLPPVCLGTSGRFRVTSDFRTSDGTHGAARPRRALVGDNASLFYFFDYDNPELLIKVLDGCAVNRHYWVFGSAATDLDYSVRVQDLASPDRGQAAYYQVQGRVVRRNGDRLGLGVIADTFAFPCSY